MDIWRILSAILRRWYVIIPLLIVTVTAAVTIGHWVEPEYTTSAVISVVPSKANIQPVPGKATVQLQAAQQQLSNPYPSATYTAGVLQYVLTDSKVQQGLLAAGLTGAYVLKPIPQTSFLGIQATATDPELAMATGHGVIESARRILAQRQSTIAASTPRVSIDVLDDADTVSVSTSGRLQSIAAVLAVGGIVSVIGTVLVDDLLLLRRRRARQTDLEETQSSNGAVSAASETVALGARLDR
ncbi:MAG: Wzz/FepE/Etk N-terminal domain-containing protein [Pseudonocardiaceae bacterium]